LDQLPLEVHHNQMREVSCLKVSEWPIMIEVGLVEDMAESGGGTMTFFWIETIKHLSSFPSRFLQKLQCPYPPIVIKSLCACVTMLRTPCACSIYDMDHSTRGKGCQKKPMGEGVPTEFRLSCQAKEISRRKVKQK